MTASAEPVAEPISQESLERLLRELWQTRGHRYRKTLRVHARRAAEGEQVVTTTSAGRETENVAQAGDYVVENQTESRERYIVRREAFERRYERADSSGRGDPSEAQLPDGWAVFQPRDQARVHALEVDDELLERLDRQPPFLIEAPWGDTQRVLRGDVLVTPPDFSEIYRIGRKEFAETYSPA